MGSPCRRAPRTSTGTLGRRRSGSGATRRGEPSAGRGAAATAARRLAPAPPPARGGARGRGPAALGFLLILTSVVRRAPGALARGARQRRWLARNSAHISSAAPARYITSSV